MSPESCRLCWTNTASLGHGSVVKCFGEKPANVAQVLQLHFRIELQPELDGTAFVCRSCWHIVSTFHQFYQSVLDGYEARVKCEEDPELIEIIDGDNEQREASPSATAMPGNRIGSPNLLRPMGGAGMVCQESRQLPTVPVELPAIDIKSEPMLVDDDPGQADGVSQSNDDEAAFIRRFVPMKCDLCDTMFATFEQLCRHLERRHHFVGYVKCCGQTLVTTSEVLQHCRKHEDECAPVEVCENLQKREEAEGPTARESPKLQEPMTDAEIRSLGKIPPILNGKYFRIINVVNKNTTTKCMTCNKMIKGNLAITSNFINHLKLHPSIYKQYNQRNLNKKPIPDQLSDSNVAHQPSTSASAESPQGNMYRKGYQKETDTLVAELIINQAVPIQLVAMPEMRELIGRVSRMRQPVDCPTMQTVQNIMKERFAALETEIQTKLRATPCVCTTADLWTSQRHSYLGVTAHWLSAERHRESYAIACVRFAGSPNCDEIVRQLTNAHARYGLNASNIVCTVTDNAANWQKAEVNDHESDEQSDDDRTDDKLLDADPAKGCRKVDVDIVDIGELLKSASSNWSLPLHVPCASHMLNLIVTADIEDSFAGRMKTNLSETYRSAMAHCAQLCNLLNSSSSKASAEFRMTFGRLIRLPCSTRWSSLFEALTDIIGLDLGELHTFCRSWNLSILTDAHIAFLEEYLQCSKPIYDALNILQGKQIVLMGNLIPNILEVHQLLHQLLQKNMLYCNRMIEHIISRLKIRFIHVFEWHLHKKVSMPFVLASITTPALKKHWIETAAKMPLARGWLLDEVTNQTEGTETATSVEPALGSNQNFKFMSARARNECESVAYLQVDQYLQDTNNDISAVKKYPLIEKVFLKYNSVLPSSAPVGKLFIQAGLVMTSESSHLSDKTFEMLTLLKANVPDKC